MIHKHKDYANSQRIQLNKQCVIFDKNENIFNDENHFFMFPTLIFTNRLLNPLKGDVAITAYILFYL